MPTSASFGLQEVPLVTLVRYMSVPTRSARMTGTILFVLPSGAYIVPKTFQIVVTAATAPGNVTNDCAVVKTPIFSTSAVFAFTMLLAVGAGVPIGVAIHSPPRVAQIGPSH